MSPLLVPLAKRACRLSQARPAEQGLLNQCAAQASTPAGASQGVAEVHADDVAVRQRLLRCTAGNDLAGIEDDDVPAQRADGMHDVLDHHDGQPIAEQGAYQLDAGLELRGIEPGQPFIE